MSTQVRFSIEREHGEVFLLVRGNVGPFHAARLSGPPEFCYPAEGGEVEITEILVDAPGHAPWTGGLTETELEDVEGKIFEATQVAREDAMAEAYGELHGMDD